MGKNDIPLRVAWQCGLCQFDVKHGDKVIVERRKKRQEITLSIEPFAERKHDLCPGRLEAASSLRMGIPCCHAHCFYLASHDNPRKLEVLVGATERSFSPPEQEERRLKKWLRWELASKLSKGQILAAPDRGLPGPRLPLEIWQMIAAYLMQHYAAASSPGQWAPSKMKPCRVRLSADIWCRYIDIEGIKYVASLSNSRIDRRSVKIYSPKIRGRLNCLYVKENYLGIVDIVPADNFDIDVAFEVPGWWWSVIHFDEKDRFLRGKSDGIKLRQLRGRKKTSTAWSLPLFKPPTLRTLKMQDFGHVPVRMASLICNDPLVTGYTWFWRGDLFRVHAHRSGEIFPSYNLSHTHWLYMPVDDGELIEEIWIRRACADKDVAIGIRTNKGREFIAGAYYKIVSILCEEFTFLHSPRPGLSRIFYEDFPEEMITLAFADGEQLRKATRSFSHQQLVLEEPYNSYLLTGYCFDRNLFYHTADLTGLNGVSACQPKGGTNITGLLLYYFDGHRESVGDVRLDSLSPVVHLRSNDAFFLGIENLEPECVALHRRPSILVTALATSKPDLGDYSFLVQITCSGRLEWIWDHHQYLALHKN